MTRRALLFFSGFFILAALVFAECQAADSLNDLAYSAIQQNGRVKPFDSFARQTVRLLTGSEKWNKKPALAVMDGVLRDPAKIPSLSWIRVDYLELKNHLGLPSEQSFFSLQKIEPSRERLATLVRSAKEKRDRDERPSKLEQSAEVLFNKIHAVEELAAGRAFAPLVRLPEQTWKINLEVFYNRARPFEAAAVFYLVGFFILLYFKKPPLSFWGIFSIWAGIACHTAGLLMRIAILSRPPVSNMYESMVYMNWALMVFAALFSAIRKNDLALTTGALVSALVMIYANLLPIDSSLDVLVPVLRSNYWLTIHVITVVSSYGAFALAMALGHRHLYLDALGKLSKNAQRQSADLLYRVIQLGVLLIGAGTFLGGVWANESWGRFWGWDPKETWALITFLGYLVIVHLRHLKKLNHFGLALGAVLGFLLVLMTWYGVNFVLGRGLHSYGQGTGGMQWVVYYLIFEAAFIGWIISKKRFSG